MPTERVRTLKRLLAPDVLRLLVQFELSQGSRPEEIAGVVLDVGRGIGSDNFGLFVVPGKALIIIFLPVNHLARAPDIYGLFSNGDFRALRAVIRAGMDFCRVAGYNKARGLNRSGISDRKIARLYGAPAEVLGSSLEYSF